MAEDTKQSPVLAPMGLVRGGTTSSRYDQCIAERTADAEARRAHEDRIAAAVEGGEEGVIARVGACNFVTAISPKLVLQYMNRDGSVRQECLSEITMYPVADGTLDLMFTLVCPKCLERGLPSGECQVMVRNSHRKFHRDERKKGVIVVETVDGPLVVHRDCTVTCDDIIRCSNVYCNWAVRIDDSKCWPV